MSYRITLGPLLYYWSRQETLNFYAEAADSAVDEICVGETVCSRRHELKAADWLDLAADLRTAGKSVRLVTRTLVETAGEGQAVRRLCGEEGYGFEAGETGAVRHLRGRAFIAGPHMNAYNGPTLHWLASLGATGFVAPLEMDRETLALLLAERPAGMQAEVMVWGRMPLAFSARCFTARHFRLKKDECAYRCSEHPDGLMLRTRDATDFLAINGVQTQSAACLDLLDQATELAAMGVDALRISPHSQGTWDAVSVLSEQRQGRACGPVSPPAGIARCNGYWFGQPGIVWHTPDEEHA
ncbi:FIG139928: Putative protease [plant metagenome]|uniref:Ubiquinone biosynthesis protein UbiV n=2 Tax=root TaxID=1 RepID=A0A1C3JYM5_9BURK|nr:U32 family peptidase [Orrella dioscoreae]SBT24254.1 FIG139928: Putative protease [Orrella dioscoreae]SOE49901.1 FIG139928: Putative protease [Orrella dioscoreae]